MQTFGLNMSQMTIRAPLSKILPSFLPVLIERGVLGYEAGSLIASEELISREQLHALLAASAFIGALNYAVEQGLDFGQVDEALIRSITDIKELTSTETKLTLELINRFKTFRIIRENHSLDDWLCESLWPAFQSSSYRYPSAMSGAVAYALNIKQSLQKCVLEY
jgi:hypothetical protein